MTFCPKFMASVSLLSDADIKREPMPLGISSRKFSCMEKLVGLNITIGESLWLQQVRFCSWLRAILLEVSREG